MPLAVEHVGGVVRVRIGNREIDPQPLGQQALQVEVESIADCGSRVDRIADPARRLRQLLDVVPLDVEDAGVHLELAAEQQILGTHFVARDVIGGIGVRDGDVAAHGGSGSLAPPARNPLLAEA